MNAVFRLDQHIDLKYLRKLLLIASAIPLFFIPFDFFNVKFQKQAASLALTPTLENRKIVHESLSEYQSVFEKSSLFGNISVQPLAVSNISVSEMIKDYRLKGVIIAGEPEAIVEDARTQKISYLHKGAALGELTVKEIQEGAMVLSYGNQDVKLVIQ